MWRKIKGRILNKLIEDTAIMELKDQYPRNGREIAKKYNITYKTYARYVRENRPIIDEYKKNND